MTRLYRQHLQGIRRAEPRTASDQGFSQHHRHTDQRDARQKHQHKRATTVDANHVGEFPDTAQTHGRTGRSENKDPTACPTAVDRNLVCRHRYYAQPIKKRAHCPGFNLRAQARRCP